MIYTREQLREELFKIIDRTLYIDYEETDAPDIEDCLDQLTDFISKLNDPYVYAEDEVK